MNDCVTEEHRNVERDCKTSRTLGKLSVCAAVTVALVLGVLLLWDRPGSRLSVAGAEEPAPAGGDPAPQRKAADNGPCYVCHLALKQEELTTTHLAEGYGCTECHGPCNEHIQDEMRMSPPDRLYGRQEVAKLCGECHDDPHEDVHDEVAAFREKWNDRRRENGRMIAGDTTCTDCHGTHNVGVVEPDTRSGVRPAQRRNLFNGRDLSGWRPSGEAGWQVGRGSIVGRAGEGAVGGDLWTRTEYEDYEAAITFKTDWPIHAGIWLRATDADPGPRVEIFQEKNPLAFTGSVH